MTYTNCAPRVRRPLYIIICTAIFIFSISAQADMFNLISYDSEQDGATLIGFIETDGSATLSQSSILSWSYTVDKGSGNLYSLTSSDADTQLYLEPGSLLDVENGELKLSGLLRIGKHFENVGGLETALNWNSTGVNRVYDAVRDGNASPWGWVAINPSSLGDSPWTIAAIPEPSILVLLAGSGSGILIYRRVFKQQS